MEQKYFKENHTEVTERIETGRTDFFSKKLKNAHERANKFAEQKRTYVYPVFGYTGVSKNFNFIGYGVPK